MAPTYSPVTICWLVAERYLYFPSLAFSIWLAFGIDRLTKIKDLRSRINIFLIFLVTVYSLRIILRNFDWRTHAGIWRATVKVSPESPKAHNNMGDVYCREGNLYKAIEEFRRAVELKPDYADAYHNLAHTYQEMGRIDEAIINYKKAISLNPKLYQSYQNLGIIYLEKGQIDFAKEFLRSAFKINPSNITLKQLLKDLEK